MKITLDVDMKFRRCYDCGRCYYHEDVARPARCPLCAVGYQDRTTKELCQLRDKIRRLQKKVRVLRGS